MKSFLKYLFILIAIFFVVGLITFIAMFISYKSNPNNPIKVFGYSYCAFNVSENKLISDTNFSKIEISSKHCSVEVKGTNDSGINVEVYNKMFGVAKLEENISYGFNKFVESDTLKILFNEPNGLFVNTSSARIVVSVPSNFASKDIIVNNTNRPIIVGNSEDNYNKLNANNITINANNNRVNILNTKNNINDVTINSNNNNINIKQSINGKLTIKTNTSSLNYISAGSIEAETKNLSIVGNRVNGDLTITGKSGYINIETVNGNVNLTGNIKTNIKSLYGSYLDTNRTSASLNIDHITNEVKTSSTSGATTIKSLSADAEISSTNGNIKVLNVSSNLTINTSSGLCEVLFLNNAETNNFIFTSSNGSLTAKNISNTVNISIKDGGICKLDLDFDKIVGDNIISGKKGEIIVTAPVQKHILSVNSNGAKESSYADVELSVNIENKMVAGATQDCLDKLTISSTTGKITLKSK